MKKIKLFLIFGTRPEAIKLAPLIKEAQMDHNYSVKTIVTGQHREMLDQVLEFFEIVPDYDLNIMSEKQSLVDITTKILVGVDNIFKKEKPDILLVHGDTTTTLASSLVAFYHKVKIGHVESGLRTWDKNSPFPEEINRQLTDKLTDLYFAPTIKNKNNLLKENCNEDNIYVTGNTAIDTLKYTVTPSYHHHILDKSRGKKMILITIHRRENWGEPMKNVFEAINCLLNLYNDLFFVFPIHKNPQIRELADQILIKSDRLEIIEPLDVVDFQNIASRSFLILSDSGGIQEEAPFLNVPVFVLRETTERPEGVSAGALKLIGTDTSNIIEQVAKIISDNKIYKRMINIKNPYGDGEASRRILKAILCKVKK
ncbi:non-hydrolyzing UDP-N-acetylglucosamine 2-epimerase [Enterococcus lactis]|uniref:non-hydrolyzing UDP-N-acetylglucosamine 2-epimerase n=1 Tax=Enterococcus lactis TaxID=357441 RepID=UPI00404386E4